LLAIGELGGFLILFIGNFGEGISGKDGICIYYLKNSDLKLDTLSYCAVCSWNPYYLIDFVHSSACMFSYLLGL